LAPDSRAGFKIRNVLVAAAIDRPAERRIDDLRDHLSDEAGPGEVLDGVWDLHSGPLCHAALDLWAAARTDPELRDLLAGVEQRIDHEIALVVRSLPPGDTDRAELAFAVKMAIAAVRGLAMRDCLQPDRDREWQATRRYLLTTFARTTRHARARLAYPSSVATRNGVPGTDG
jgi:hypothetical protein